MKNLFTARSKNIYLNILFVMLVTILVTVSLLSAILYINFENISLSLIHDYIKDNLSQISYSATFMTESANGLAIQIFFDSYISKLMYNFAPEAQDLTGALKQLQSYRASIQNIHSIYVYNSYTDNIYSNSNIITMQNKASFYDQEILRMIDNSDIYKPLVPIPRKVPISTAPGTDTTYANVYTFLFHDRHSGNAQIRNAVVLNISESWIRKIIDTMENSDTSDTFIIDSNGVAIIDSHKYKMFLNLSGEAYIQKLLTSKNQSGYFIDKVDNVKYLVTYVYSKELGWRFVRLTPYSEIVNKINALKVKTVVICLIILCAAIILTFFTSRRLFNPIDIIIKKNKTLEEEKRENHITLKQEFLGNLISGKANLTLPELFQEFGKYRISLSPSDEFILILFRIDHFSDFDHRYNSEDHAIFKFAILNIACEICSNHFNNESVDIGNDHVVLFFNIPKIIAPDFYENLNNVIKEIQTLVQKHLDISLSASVSSVGSTASELSSLYFQALNISNFRLYYGYNCILYPEIGDNFNLESYSYPAQKERLLTGALKLEQLEEVKNIYMDIIDYSKKFSFSLLNLTVLRLATSISIITDSIEKSPNFDVHWDINGFITNLNKAEVLDEINDQFNKLFAQIISDMKGKKNNKYNDLLDNINQIINKNYMDQGLSLESIADSVNMSSIYLGRLYKSLTSNSIANCIKDVRITKAKQLLETTNYSVNEISEKTGFLSVNYFCTVFKKETGATPNDYRQNNNIDK